MIKKNCYIVCYVTLTPKLSKSDLPYDPRHMYGLTGAWGHGAREQFTCLECPIPNAGFECKFHVDTDKWIAECVHCGQLYNNLFNKMDKDLMAVKEVLEHGA